MSPFDALSVVETRTEAPLDEVLELRRRNAADDSYQEHTDGGIKTAKPVKETLVGIEEPVTTIGYEMESSRYLVVSRPLPGTSHAEVLTDIGDKTREMRVAWSETAVYPADGFEKHNKHPIIVRNPRRHDEMLAFLNTRARSTLL